MENKIIKERLSLLKQEMKANGVDCYMLPTSDFHNSEYVDDYFKAREYFSNFTGSNGTLVVREEETGLWTDGRYFIQAENELAGTGITLFRMQEEGVPTIQEYLEKEMKGGQTLGFDGRVVDCRFGKKLEKALGEKDIAICYEKDLAGSLWEDRPALPCHEAVLLPEQICGQTCAGKVARVREKMKEKKASYFLLSKLDDLMWLLNIRGKDVACNPVALSYGFITMDEIYLFLQKGAVTDGLRAYAEKYQIVIKDYFEITEFLKGFSYQGAVLYDSGNLNYALYKTICEKTECIDEKNPTELMKAVKNPVELQNMREVFLTDNVVVTKFIYWLKQNVGKIPLNEYTAAMKLDGMRREAEGFLDLSFETISGYKENAAMMHYEATQENHKEIRAEGMLLVDSGGQYMGGTTDITRTIVLGEISEEEKKHFSAVAAGMIRLSNAKFLYGCTGRNVDILAREPMWEMNIDYKCGTGHGVGYILNVHEGPQGIRWKYIEGQTEAVLEEGMNVTNEPGVYREGSHGIRTENVMLVRKGEKNADGQFMYFETLTFVPIDREALDKKYLTETDVKRIDAYHEEVYQRISPRLTKEEAEWLREVTLPL